MTVGMRIQQPMIDRQPNAAIADLRQQLNRLLRIVVREAAHLSSTGRLVLDHLRGSDQPAGLSASAQ